MGGKTREQPSAANIEDAFGQFVLLQVGGIAENCRITLMGKAVNMQALFFESPYFAPDETVRRTRIEIDQITDSQLVNLFSPSLGEGLWCIITE
uniref:hypothetical protein n=1 Tax=Paracoccus aurantius TaxID=3073814 RepID=UPI0038FC5616